VYVCVPHRHNGIAELLEILGSIINGFAIPLKKEHIQFLEKALIPLHKPRGVAIYHPQLSYCISQYVEKDPETIVIIVNGLVRFWPWTNAAKQVRLKLRVLARCTLLVVRVLGLHRCSCVKMRSFRLTSLL
jgi:serine/threonine-protein phosphatase 2A regulatory subunit B'